MRDQGLIPLENAVAMCTSLAADRVELRDRGRLVDGAAADIVVFDAGQVMDRATFERPKQFPIGIEHVLVNGVQVVEAGRQHDDRRPGRLLGVISTAR